MVYAIVGFVVGVLIMYLCGSRLIKFQWKMIDYFNEETKEIPKLEKKIDELEYEIYRLDEWINNIQTQEELDLSNVEKAVQELNNKIMHDIKITWTDEFEP